MAGTPAREVSDVATPATVAVLPTEFVGVKPRLLVREGESVRRGQPVFADKRNAALMFGAPAGGVVREIRYGARRVIEEVVIEVSPHEEVEQGTAFSPSRIAAMSREEALAPLLKSGLLALIRQRPFSRIASPEATPKAVFVNGMNTAPFLPDPDVAVRGEEAAFQAGLDVLGRLTPGRVHLCLPAGRTGLSPALSGARGVVRHEFEGPHPSGNTSVHIHHIDPIRPGDVVWTVRAADVILIGQLFLTGQYPAFRVVSLGGPGVVPAAARHYRLRIGSALAPLLRGRLADGAQRVIAGDVLAGRAVAPDGHLGLLDAAVTVVPEGGERHFLGWMGPGLREFSHSRTFLSSWLGHSRPRPFDTLSHGGLRAMVATGLYDRFVPMRIMTDFLVRAVLAHDTDEAVKLGLLEVDPEDFALPAFACPSKLDLVGIIRQGLDELEAEGL